MKFRVNHFEDVNGVRALVCSQVLRGAHALKALLLYLQPDAPVEDCRCTNRYGEYRSGTTLVRAVALR